MSLKLPKTVVVRARVITDRLLALKHVLVDYLGQVGGSLVRRASSLKGFSINSGKLYQLILSPTANRLLTIKILSDFDFFR